MHRAVVVFASLGVIGACAELREAPPTDGGATSSSSGNASSSSGGTTSGGPPDNPGDAGPDAPKGPQYYDDVQKTLAAKRFPGPTTSQGSKGTCTKKYFVWKDNDGTLHSWAGKTQTKIDYAFKAQIRPYFVPADALIAVDQPSYTGIGVYETAAANTPVSTLPYSFNFVSANDGVIRLDQMIDGTSLGGTKVRRWVRATGAIEDITTTVLPTVEPPSSFVNDLLVIPGATTTPHPLYLVDVVKKTVTSVTFDGAVTMHSADGPWST